MCELCEPYGSREVAEDTRSTTPEDAGDYERYRESRWRQRQTPRETGREDQA